LSDGKQKEQIGMCRNKQERLLEIFFRGLRGEAVSVRQLADEYGVSTKSISRNISDLKAFLADHRDLVGETELRYNHQDKCYRLYMDEFLSNPELFAVVEVLIGARAFSKMELLKLISKLKRFTTPEDRPKLEELIRKEIYHYNEIHHDCDSVQDNLWQLMECITKKKEISIDYYRMDRSFVTHRLRPSSLMFTDFYFYLIAYKTEDPDQTPLYFRVDRIKHITEHRSHFTTSDVPDFDEGLLRQRSVLMWPGKLQTIRFLFTGPSVQSVLDKLPSARIVERNGKEYLIEAEIYGDGIKMWLLSQGAWVKVIAPESFVKGMRMEIEKLALCYDIAIPKDKI
jgi:predicted DNA-binding transcriptional regulator YafY